MSSADKGSKLQEASEEQQFLRTVSDFDLWIDEVDKALASEDLGKVTNQTCNFKGSATPWNFAHFPPNLCFNRNS